MKEIGKFEQSIGGDGGKVVGSIGVEESNLAVAIKALYPLVKVIEPVTNVVDGWIDKLEAAIYGDQKILAAQAKADIRAQLVKIFGE